jgi:rare lipoprotein A
MSCLSCDKSRDRSRDKSRNKSGRLAIRLAENRRAIAPGSKFRKTALWVAFAPALLAVAACAPSPFTTNRTEFVTPGRQASLPDRQQSLVAIRHQILAKRSTSIVAKKHPAKASDGVASFYTEDTETASGEKFNPYAMTAAHPSLPFGTRVRVTNLRNGRSVVVRINDRGPYVPGRVVDVSYSAAESLGIVQSGLAKVKLDVVH